MKISTIFASFSLIVSFTVIGCDGSSSPENSDTKQAEQQEQITAQGTAAVGMPAITNFRERRLLKDIYEMRDNDGLLTWTYTFSEQTGRYTLLGQTIGYPIPYATEFTNPQKIAASCIYSQAAAYATLPQADPNGLFSPSSAEGTWIMLKDPHSTKVSPVYVEPRVICSPFPLPDALVIHKE